jgi:catechol-2,3-dioxygenase
MAPTPRLRFSHIGFHVHDMDGMIAFYTALLGLELTDRGHLAIPGEPEIAFLSADPSEHHQIALVAGRQDGGIERGVINQISFQVDRLDDLRAMQSAAEALGVTRFLPLDHGNAWSLYFPDPEGNGIECFVPSPWHVRQPVTVGFDLSLPDEEIRARTQAACRSAPDFEPIEDWREAFAKRLELRRGGGTD